MPSIVIPIVAGIGNALMAVPMVRQLRRGLPGARVTIVARTDAMGEVFRRLPEVDEVLVTGAGWKGVRRNVAWSRARRPDYYLVPFPSNRWQYSMLAATSGAERRILHAYPVGRWRALHVLPATRVPSVRGIHDVVQNVNLLRELGVEPDPTEAPVFPVSDEDRARADQRLAGWALAKDEPFIAVHAGSARTVLARAKRWPSPNYARLIEQMTHELSLAVMLLEGPDERGVGEEIMSHFQPAAAAAHARVTTHLLRGPLGDAAAVLERAALYVGSDSGLAHLAAAVGTRAVTLFGPADADRVSPFGNRDLVVQAPRNCGPCFLYPWQAPYPKIRCREPYCIDSVTVDAVMATVRRARALSRTASLSPVNRGEGRGEGQGARGVEHRSLAQAARPSPPPSPRRSGERE